MAFGRVGSPIDSTVAQGSYTAGPGKDRIIWDGPEDKPKSPWSWKRPICWFRGHDIYRIFGDLGGPWGMILSKRLCWRCKKCFPDDKDG